MKLNRTLAAALLAVFPLAGRCENMIDVDADLDLLQVRTGLGHALKPGGGELYGRADYTHYGYTLNAPAGSTEITENDDGLGAG